jgi:hypothetical protein
MRLFVVYPKRMGSIVTTNDVASSAFGSNGIGNSLDGVSLVNKLMLYYQSHIARSYKLRFHICYPTYGRPI